MLNCTPSVPERMTQMNKIDNLLATAMIASEMAGGEYSTPMPKMKLSRRSVGQQVYCHVCGKTHVTLYKDNANSGEYICKQCKDSLVQAVPESILEEACNKIKEEGCVS